MLGRDDFGRLVCSGAFPVRCGGGLCLLQICSCTGGRGTVQNIRKVGSLQGNRVAPDHSFHACFRRESEKSRNPGADRLGCRRNLQQSGQRGERNSGKAGDQRVYLGTDRFGQLFLCSSGGGLLYKRGASSEHSEQAECRRRLVSFGRPVGCGHDGHGIAGTGSLQEQ